MGKKSFYTKESYQKKQAEITKRNWQKGVFDFIRKREERTCKSDSCKNAFVVNPSDFKKFCSRSCAAAFNNKKRGNWPEKVKKKIASSLMGKPNNYKGIIKVPRDERMCANLPCGKVFTAERYRATKY